MSQQVLYRTGTLGLVIAHVDTASDTPLTPDEEFIVAMSAERDRLQATVDKLVTAIMADDNWQDDWCVICHGHPGHDNTHGGNDCPMIELAAKTRKDVTR